VVEEAKSSDQLKKWDDARNNWETATAYRESFSSERSAAITRNPLINPSTYLMFDRAFARESGWFTGTTYHEDVKWWVEDSARALIDGIEFGTGTKDESQRTKAIVDAYSLIGIPVEDVLSGTLNIGRDPRVVYGEPGRLNVGGSLVPADTLNVGGIQVPLAGPPIELKGTPYAQVDISKAEINPFTVPLWDTDEAMRAWMATESGDGGRLDALFARFGIETSQYNITNFVDAQTAAIARLPRKTSTAK
jgi:hypothetical protein